MELIRWVIVAVAIFFAGGWLFGLVVRREFRLRSTIVAVVYWWIGIGLAVANAISVFHLLWFMPLVLIVTMVIWKFGLSLSFRSELLDSNFGFSVPQLFVLAGVPCVAALAIAAYLT